MVKLLTISTSEPKPSNKLWFIPVVALLVVAAGLALILSKNARSKLAMSTQVTQRTQSVLPFEHEFSATDHKLYAVVKGERLLAEFDPWGSHARGNGGHVEGEYKSNFMIHIRPKNLTKELNGAFGDEHGDRDGVCEAEEACGVTAATAFEFAPWYFVPIDGLAIVDMHHDVQPERREHYLPGEGDQWRITLKGNGTQMYFQHLGELSKELQTMIADSGQASLLNSKEYTQLRKPILLPKGLVFARPQIERGETATVDGEVYYGAQAEAEWSYIDQYGDATRCQYENFSVEDQRNLQRALEENILHAPSTQFALFPPASKLGPDTLAIFAEGKLCATHEFDRTNYDHLGSEGGYGWYDSHNSKPRAEILSVFPIHKDTTVYETYKSNFHDTNSDYLLVRSFDVGSPYGRGEYITMSGISTLWVQAEVLDLHPGGDTAGEHTLVAHVYASGEDRPEDGTMVGKFFGVRYRIEKNRLVVRWGDLAASREAVVLPEAIPANPLCDGAPISCYSHDLDPKR